MRQTIRRVARFVSQDEGATLIEYGMLILLIAAICILVVQAIGTKVSNGYATFNSQIP